MIAALLGIAFAAPLAAVLWRSFAAIPNVERSELGDTMNVSVAVLILILILSGVIR